VADLEDVVTTLVRLLDTNMRLVKDDGSVGNVHVSEAWYDRDFLKTYDAQVTVSGGERVDRKIGTSGTKRLTIGSPRVNIWVLEKSDAAESGRSIRNKLQQEIARIIREKRTKPYITEYTFWNLGTASKTHKAYEAAATSELSPDDAEWSEIPGTGYNKIWYSDDDRHSKSANVDLEYALLLFRFKTTVKPSVLTSIELNFEGYGTAPGGNGVTIKVWNFTSEAWESAQSGTSGGDETIAITLTSALANYLDADGYLYLLARTTNPSDGETDAVIYCDYVECVITVHGITYADLGPSRDADRVDVKPIILRTEFVLTTWLFETVMIT